MKFLIKVILCKISLGNVMNVSVIIKKKLYEFLCECNVK